MPTILDTIIERTRTGLGARKRSVPIRVLEDQPGYAPARRDFVAALRRDRLCIIAESKKASPSQGEIRTPYDAAANATAYERGGADALSVLTEPDFFSGSLADLAAARAAVAIPILRKDFLVDPYQLIEARAFGADAVLLIASVLDRSQLADLMDAAGQLELSCLVECHDEHELDRIDLDRVRILGVNNRDLKTFEVDRSHAARVLQHVPDRIVRVAESGMRNAADLAAVRRSGIDAVLIGETFMRAPDPGLALQTLARETEVLLGEYADAPDTPGGQATGPNTTRHDA